MDIRAAVAQPPMNGARDFAIAVGILLALGAAGCLRAGRKAEGKPPAVPEPEAPAVGKESAAEKQQAQPAAQDIERPEEEVTRAKEEEEAETMRQRAFESIESWDTLRKRMDELVEKYPDSEAARKLRESGLFELALKRQKEDEEAWRALARLRASIREHLVNNAYKDACAAALRSSEYRQFGSHKLFQDLMEHLKAKAVSSPRQAHESLVDAMRASDGATVWSLVSRNGKQYYENMLRYARGDVGFSKGELHPAERMMAEGMTRSLPLFGKEELASMDGRDFFLRLSSIGALGWDTIANAPLVRIEEPVGDRCKVWLWVEVKEVPLVLKKEEDGWKWDPFDAIAAANATHDANTKPSRGSFSPRVGGARKRPQEKGISEP